MNSLVMLVLLPFVVLVAAFLVILVVALCRARPEDIPGLVSECGSVFRRFADRLPDSRVTGQRHDVPDREEPS